MRDGNVGTSEQPPRYRQPRLDPLDAPEGLVLNRLRYGQPRCSQAENHRPSRGRTLRIEFGNIPSKPDSGGRIRMKLEVEGKFVRARKETARRSEWLATNRGSNKRGGAPDGRNSIEIEKMRTGARIASFVFDINNRAGGTCGRINRSNEGNCTSTHRTKSMFFFRQGCKSSLWTKRSGS